MRCDQFDRWLDEGMPARDSAAARAHAAGCARCSAAVSAAETVEIMLGAAPPPAPAVMAMRVMERVENVERARQRLAASERAWGAGRTWRGWASALAQEPAAVVAIALVPVFLIFVIAWPETTAALGTLTRDALAVWLTTASSGVLIAAAGFGGAMPHGAVPFNALLLPAMVATVLGAFVWLGAAFRPLRSPRPRKPPRA